MGFGKFTPGQYEIKVRLSEVGDPWDENVRKGPTVLP